MSVAEVVSILGELPGNGLGDLGLLEIKWHEGPNRIAVAFAIEDMSVRYKVLTLATSWETLIWYAKQGAEKIGVTWE